MAPAGTHETAPRPRRQQILDLAARLFATRGFHGVSVDEIGAAAGITGPGLYRHFRGKDAMLTELLVGISQRLLAEGRRRVADAASPADALFGLIRGHVDFALDESALIVLHDRDLDSLPENERRRVRRLQREYVELWVRTTAQALPGYAGDGDRRCRAAVHAVFGLINSTPYSAAPRRGTRLPGRDVMSDLLQALAGGALRAGAESAGPGADAKPGDGTSIGVVAMADGIPTVDQALGRSPRLGAPTVHHPATHPQEDR